jgi:hypothetical protein
LSSFFPKNFEVSKIVLDWHLLGRASPGCRNLFSAEQCRPGGKYAIIGGTPKLIKAGKFRKVVQAVQLVDILF